MNFAYQILLAYIFGKYCQPALIPRRIAILGTAGRQVAGMTGCGDADPESPSRVTGPYGPRTRAPRTPQPGTRMATSRPCPGCGQAGRGISMTPQSKSAETLAPRHDHRDRTACLVAARQMRTIPRVRQTRRSHDRGTTQVTALAREYPRPVTVLSGRPG